MNRLILVALFSILFSTIAYSHNITLKGQIKDAETKKELVFATITIKGTNLVAYTDESGFYTFSGLHNDKVSLIVFMSGYKKSEKDVALSEGENLLNIDLVPTQIDLDEVVVTANRNETKRKEASVIVGVLD